MNFLYQITVDDYLEVVRRSKEAGIKAGESMDKIFIQYMEEKGQKAICGTDLTRNEIVEELVEKNGNILEITTDSEGRQIQRLIKKNNNIEE